ncbi:helix-turn-helix domain-containing protein [Streptomyces sp. 891-h]|uniref:helix-turn-helix domain-containing protein n=1 Tax=Streptomyces sp. 891-h TaxID=2720714 RepID=UPI001FAAAAF9|nr:helix-turn-helix domain-containing protein [Streptomyces sp. 891-h]UNZ20769.1 PucR family transcriptional regulator [Streptomyces sp. 891-h]
MLNLRHLTTGPHPILRFPEKPERPEQPQQPAKAAARTMAQHVEDVVVCDARWRLPTDTPRARAGLAVLPTGPADGAGPQCAGTALRGLLAAGVVAVALAPAATPAAEEAARTAGLPLLVPAGPWDAEETLRRVLRRQLTAEREHTRRTARVLALSSSLAEQAEGPARLLREVAALTGGPLTLVEPGQAEWDRLAAEHPGTLEEVRCGRVRAAAVPFGDQELLLHAVGRDRPHPVLAALRPGDWPPHLRQLLAHTAGQVALLDCSARHRRNREVLRTALRGVRVSVLQYLMLGNWEGAVRVAEPLARLGAAEYSVGEVLAAARGVVTVVQSANGKDLTETVAACEEAVGDRGLVVPCPANPRHVIVLVPHDPDGGEPSARLRRVVERTPGHLAGVSGPRPWSQTALAYQAATRALAAARNEPGGIARDPGESSLLAFLSPRARSWSHQVCVGLRKLTEEQRSQAVPTARRALSYGALRAGRLLGVDRTTANKRLRLVLEAMGLDHRQVAHRAVADLAFQLTDLPVPPDHIPQAPPVLRALLREYQVVDWAKRELALLEQEGDAQRLLATWLAHDCRAGATAEALGMHRNTLAARLSALGARLRLPLGEQGAARYQALWLLVAAGRVPVTAVPDPVAPGA